MHIKQKRSQNIHKKYKQRSACCFILLLYILRGLFKDDRKTLLTGVIFVLLPLTGYFGAGGWLTLSILGSIWSYLVVIGRLGEGEEPKIAVFLCGCGDEIASALYLEQVAGCIRQSPGSNQSNSSSRLTIILMLSSDVSAAVPICPVSLSHSSVSGCAANIVKAAL